MTETDVQGPDRWVQYFARRGYPSARRLASGTEGTVYRLRDGTVAKVWAGRAPEDFDLTRRLYADIARHPLPFGTPRILDAEEHDGVLVSYELELGGSPLRSDGDGRRPARDLPRRETDALLTVLRALASVPGSEVMRRLVIQGDDRPLWQGHSRFPDALAALVERAAGRNRDALAAHVPGLAGVVSRTAASLRALPDRPESVVHGDLVPPNIHLDEAGHPVAVLDFGFCTTAGDPAFEAAVTAAVWDMYGPDAAHHTAELTRLFARELGHAEEVLELYRKAYALITYDLFGTGPQDGHFRWCAALLR
ncbi:phosphotransferase family protein [Streptomyces sp. WAC04114]|uniref:phosphotransferase family protein n=1 Tax=Streptomyces sp. WAC04114 TaxID=2867961 RepID=UPI001C8C8DBE|nr:aminoglycoside phosphotransferase family protein [Streptomyces sp. WAC04114]MBX9361529.1 aminoglycoside phosphotransferase family protein [Streptomyces sp. WAC04114]